MAGQGAKLATGWLELVVGTRGGADSIAKEIVPGAKRAGDRAGSTLGSSLWGAVKKWAAPIAIAAGVGKLLSTGFAEVKDAAATTAQLTAGIASTGNAANVSVGGLNALASSIQGYSGQTDDSIAAAQGLLLTFTNIRNVGADKIFDQATVAAANMAARMGGDAASKATMLGKALNDPIAGISSLSRAGVQFTAQQKDQIKAMVEAGDTLGAQKIIMKELETQFGGSAAAFGNTMPGMIQRFKRAFEDMSQGLVGAATPVLSMILPGLINGMLGLVPVAEAVGGAVNTAFAFIGSAVSVVRAAFSGNPPTAALGAWVGPLTTFGAALRQVFDSVGPILSQIGAAIAPVFASLGASFGPLIPQLVDLWTNFSPLSIIFQAIGPLLPQLAAAFGQLATTIGGALGSALQVLLPTMQQLAGVVAGALGTALSALLPVVVQVVGLLGPIFSTVISALLPIITMLASLFGELVAAVVPLLAPVLSLVAPLVQLVGSILGPLAQLLAAVLTPIIALVSWNVKMLVPALKLVIDVLVTVIGWIVQFGTWLTKAATANQQTGKAINSIWRGIQSFFATVFGAIGRFFSQTWSNLQSIVRNALNGIRSTVMTIFANVQNFFRSGITNIISYFTSLPGRVLSALGNLGSLLMGAGRSLIQGFINGIKGMLGAVGNAVGGIMDFVSGFFPHSPAKRGRFSGSGWTAVLTSGLALGEQFSEGLRLSEPAMAFPFDALGGSTTSLRVAPSGGGDTYAPSYALAAEPGRPLFEQVNEAERRMRAVRRRNSRR